MHFSTGASEREGRNLAANPEGVLTTGDNTLSEGIDVVVEGRAERVTDGDRLNRPARLVATCPRGPHASSWAGRGGLGRR
uniref:pyridoxamine 5'-phosphate oxidase family protein n=1 Tax=Streptomyces atratus TaxID=1893 RepID=UPI0027E50F02|nr:pyridoxamine 5'-phosphate oxidase family protein [Streptomyces atratus]